MGRYARSALTAALLALASCTVAAPTCDPKSCIPGNACIAGWQTYDEALTKSAATQTTECRLPCASQSDCPFNHHCVAGSPTSYCVADRATYSPAHAGEAAAGLPWGAPCNPEHATSSDANAPLIDNPDCDTAQQFWCYATSPTSPGYCTQYQCRDDGDCPGGWWCATIDDTPDARFATRKVWGTTTSVCMPRVYDLTPGSYCAPCQSDLDCPAHGGNPQHCVSADNGKTDERVCASECASDGECPLDQACTASDAAGADVCLPRAKTCAGDGRLCSPCRSDADCTSGGLCMQASYSTEHFCTVPAKDCAIDSSGGYPSCPYLPLGAYPPNTTTEGVGCMSGAQSPMPGYQCIGNSTAFGAGCWSNHHHCKVKGASCTMTQAMDCCSGTCGYNDTCD